MRSVFDALQCSTHYPNWLKTSALQQGITFILVSIISLVLMSWITISYVDYHLDELNDEIEHNIEDFLQGKTTELDDEPIDEDDVISILIAGFVLAGILVTILSSVVVYRIAKGNQDKIDNIEQVLRTAASGDLSVRTHEAAPRNDLARIGYAVDEMLFQLQGAVSSMKDISANISHELKTPITRLQHILLILRETADALNIKSDGFNEQLALSLQESGRLATIFDALLRISQIESGHRRQRFEPVNICKIFTTLSDIYTDVADDAGMALRVQCSDCPVVISGDKELLTQALVNLIENSLRYCSAGQTIDLSYYLNDSTVIISVTDNGPGVSNNDKERVFERLYRVNKARNDGGVGLGLSLVKAVTELHHGSVTLFDCHPGLGVKMVLPSRTK